MQQRLDLRVTDLGATQLKNIVQPIRVYVLDVGMPAQAKPTKAAEPVMPAAPTPQKRRFGLAPVAGALAAVLPVVIAGAWWFLNANRPASVATNAPRLSMVVLPFANLSGDPAQDYLVDALTDELSTSLARLARLRGSFVIARNTAMTFKGKPVDAKAIGKDLGVRYILEGSVQPSGDQMRVNAQLIDAGSGEHLWAEQFDTPRADLLQAQDAIVRHLARAMDVQLIAAEAARLKRTPAANPDAQDLALQCEAAAYKSAYVVKEDYRFCEQALAIDPNNVLALTMLGVKFSMQAGVGISGDPKGDLERADELESKALGLDPDYAVAHLVKGNILQIQGRNEEAIVEHERALALDPSQVDAHANLGVDYLYLGEFDKSIQYADKAISMSLYDPALLYWYGIKAWANFGLKRYDQAIEWARRAIAINPNYFLPPHVILVAALALTDHDAEAREALRRYLALPSSGPLKTIGAWKARNMSLGGNPRFVESNERTSEGLRKAGLPEE